MWYTNSNKMNLFVLMVLFVCSVTFQLAHADEENKNNNNHHDNDKVHNEVVFDEKLKSHQKLTTKVVPPSCASQVYCQGRLLHTVQMSAIFNDSKHFVDMTMLDDEEKILAKFDKFMNDNNQKPTNDKIETFVNENFAFSNELENWSPEDYTAEPPFLSTITNEEYRKYAKIIISIWPELGRKVSNDTLTNINRHSLLPLTEGFIIPGGRFRETYYWDTYWIIKGLLISNMTQTARGMLDNFVTLVKAHGFIPNGARVYYNERSQPPLFASMVHEYHKATKDDEWLRANIKHVGVEVSYWLNNRMQTIDIGNKQYSLARYYPESLGPRPESYKEDYKTASLLPTEGAKEQLYTNLKGGAESGWDFSSRWFYDSDGGSDANLTQIDMKRTIPVDLNSFLYNACRSLSIMHFDLNQLAEAAKWLNKAIKLRAAIRAVLFHEEDGIWYDYDTQLKRHRRDFYVSNVAPLWVRAEHESFQPEKLIKKLHDEDIFDYVGGTPASLKRTGEQWDLPNAWPPLQAIFVQAIANTGTDEGKRIATKLADTWIRANIIGYQNTNSMFEKYDALTQGQYGGGGEYDVQSGFGWTNGVFLELIKQYYTVRQ